MDLSFLCIIGMVIVMGFVAVAGHRFRMKTVNYMTQKARNPSLEPPKDVKIGNSIIRFLILALMVGLGGFMLYSFISTGQLIAASIIGVFLVLAIMIIFLVGSYWKDNFDL